MRGGSFFRIVQALHDYVDIYAQNSASSQYHFWGAHFANTFFSRTRPYSRSATKRNAEKKIKERRCAIGTEKHIFIAGHALLDYIGALLKCGKLKCTMSLCEVLGGRGRQLPATFEVHALELRALREVLSGRVTTPDRFAQKNKML